MLLFHGTSGPRSRIEAIFEEGLKPHGGRDWAHAMTRVKEHVFVCTTPVGSRDGDPIRFAQQAAHQANAAWLVVIDSAPPSGGAEARGQAASLVDVPRGSPLVVGAIGNGELARYWTTRAFAASVLDTNFGATRTLLAAARTSGRPIRDLLTPYVAECSQGLVDGTPDAATLLQFEAAFLRAGFDDKARVARSYRLNVPQDYLEDSHHATCAACTYQLFDVRYQALGITHLGAPVTFSRGGFEHVDLATFAANLETLGRWLATYDDVYIDRVVGKRKRLALADLQRALPPPHDVVPSTFWPDLATHDLAERMTEPDTQLMLHAIPPANIVGAIELGTHDKLSRLVRPGSGETLPNKLLHLAHELRDRREESGRPVLRRA